MPVDGDGFPDFVTSVQGSMVSDGNVVAARTVPYVTWGGSTAEAGGRRHTGSTAAERGQVGPPFPGAR